MKANITLSRDELMNLIIILASDKAVVKRNEEQTQAIDKVLTKLEKAIDWVDADR